MTDGSSERDGSEWPRLFEALIAADIAEANRNNIINLGRVHNVVTFPVESGDSEQLRDSEASLMDLNTGAGGLAGLSDTLIRTTYLSLATLLNRHPIAFAELVSRVRDERHELVGEAAQVLDIYGLLDSSGRIHQAVREIVLASTAGDGLDLRLLPASDVIGTSPSPGRPAVPSPMTDQQKTDLIAQCLMIAAIFDEEFPGAALAAKAYRDGGVNGFHGRTTSGLYLEFSYGAPNKIWTPWGYWRFASGTGRHFGEERQSQMASFMARLTAELHIPLQQSEFGDYGPVYKLLAVDGVELPPPGEVMASATLDESRAARAEWARLGGPDSTYAT